MKRFARTAILLLVATTAAAEEPLTDASSTETPTSKPAAADGAPKALSGMSILGNQEAPKSLVIVPWQSSAPGTAIGISTLLDDSRRPVDRDVFLRALSYYEIRTETTNSDSR
ncbi:MAG: hypothetical protein OEV00_00050 [Acidobacteriota bacterium]|nr:hypothetical protein [Acidobacteriota bacterium]MDH3783695.1 hypothetical protein [Acidobacteriota bacterium]